MVSNAKNNSRRLSQSFENTSGKIGSVCYYKSALLDATRLWVLQSDRFGTDVGCLPWVDGDGRPRELPTNEDGELVRWKRSVWEIPASKGTEEHYATYPERLVEPCVLASTRRGDTVLDPFAGTGTTLVVALKYGRDCIGIEGKKEYVKSMQKRLEKPIHVKLLDVIIREEPK